MCQEQSQWLYRWNLPETGDVSFPSSLSPHTSSSSADLTKSASCFLGNCLPLLISARRPKAIPPLRGLPCYVHHYGATLNLAHCRHSACVCGALMQCLVSSSLQPVREVLLLSPLGHRRQVQIGKVACTDHTVMRSGSRHLTLECSPVWESWSHFRGTYSFTRDPVPALKPAVMWPVLTSHTQQS